MPRSQGQGPKELSPDPAAVARFRTTRHPVQGPLLSLVPGVGEVSSRFGCKPDLSYGAGLKRAETVMPWEKSYTEEDVLEAAMRAFWARGYQATSMADLVAATGLNRGSLYAGFGNKRDLFVLALQHYDRTYRIGALEELRRGREPKEAIFAAFDMAGIGNETLPGGCMMVNAAMEMAPHDPAIATIVEASMRQVEEFFADCLHAARARGGLPEDRDIKNTAKVLQGLMVGLFVLRRARADHPAFDAINAELHRILG